MGAAAGHGVIFAMVTTTLLYLRCRWSKWWNVLNRVDLLLDTCLCLDISWRVRHTTVVLKQWLRSHDLILQYWLWHFVLDVSWVVCTPLEDQQRFNWLCNIPNVFDRQRCFHFLSLFGQDLVHSNFVTVSVLKGSTIWLYCINPPQLSLLPKARVQ